MATATNLENELGTAIGELLLLLDNFVRDDWIACPNRLSVYEQWLQRNGLHTNLYSDSGGKQGEPSPKSTTKYSEGLLILPTFFDLPRELRDQILAHVVIEPDHTRLILSKWCGSRYEFPALQPAISVVNRQLRAESLAIFYSSNTFKLWVFDRHVCGEAWRWLPAIGTFYFECLQKLHLHWGSRERHRLGTIRSSSMWAEVDVPAGVFHVYVQGTKREGARTSTRKVLEYIGVASSQGGPLDLDRDVLPLMDNTLGLWPGRMEKMFDSMDAHDWAISV